MSTINPPPGSGPGPILNRMVERIEKVELADGISREIHHTVITFQDQGVWRTREETTITPPLDCNDAVKDIYDVTVCFLCRRVVCVSKHSFICQHCGNTACNLCRVEIPVDDKALTVCRVCAEEIGTPKIVRFIKRLIWG